MSCSDLSSTKLWIHFIGLLWLGQLSQDVSGEACTDRFINLSLLQYRAAQIPNVREVGDRLDREIRIIKDIQFNCTAEITKIILGLDVRRNRELYPNVHIWRPVGSTYNFVPDSERTIYYSTNNVSTNGVFEYPLDPPIPVQSGDLLAVSQPPQMDSQVRLYSISDNEFNFESYSVGLSSTSVTLSAMVANTDLVLIYPITNKANSVRSSVTPELIRTNSLRLHSVQMREKRQYIYPQIRFSCNGTVTKWIYGALDRGSQRDDLPELQIWRQTGPNSYNKQGSSLVISNSTSDSNIHEFYPASPLEFQEGDMLGTYVPSNRDARLTLYNQDGNGPLNLRVMGMVDPPAPSTISEPLQTDGSNDYPLVTLEIKASSTVKGAINTPHNDAPLVINVINMTTNTKAMSSSIANFDMTLYTTDTSTSGTVPTIITDASTWAAIPSISVSPDSTHRLHTTQTNNDLITITTTHLILAVISATIVLLLVIICAVTVCGIMFCRLRKKNTKKIQTKRDADDLQFNPLYYGLGKASNEQTEQDITAVYDVIYDRIRSDSFGSIYATYDDITAEAVATTNHQVPMNTLNISSGRESYQSDGSVVLFSTPYSSIYN